MKEGAIIHLVLTRSCDLVEPHVPSRSARQRGVNSDDTLYLDLQCKSQGQAPAPFRLPCFKVAKRDLWEWR